MSWHNWGVSMEPLSMRHMLGEECPHCDYGRFVESAGVSGQWYMYYVVGFSKSEDVFTRDGDRDGAIAIECPRCFKIFWRHIICDMSLFFEDLEMGLFKLLVPGAHDAFMAAYNRALKEMSKAK